MKRGKCHQNFSTVSNTAIKFIFLLQSCQSDTKQRENLQREDAVKREILPLHVQNPTNNVASVFV